MHSVSLKFLVGILSFSDYSPFGMQMPGRNGGEDYRYAFNGMEHDPEVSGDGNSYTTEFRAYDPRRGRWKSLDPLMAKFPHQSPYVAFNNNPIYYVDPTGLEGVIPGDPPQKENTVGAPEGNVNALKNSFRIIDETATEAAFDKETDDPTYGYVLANDDYAKVFFDANATNADGSKGAYFAQKPIKKEVGRGAQWPVMVSFDESSNVSDATIQQIDNMVGNMVSSNVFSDSEPILDKKQPVKVGIIYSRVDEKGLEKANAEQIVGKLKEKYPSVQFYATDDNSKGSAINGFAIIGPEMINVITMKKQNTYGF